MNSALPSSLSPESVILRFPIPCYKSMNRKILSPSFMHFSLLQTLILTNLQLCSLLLFQEELKHGCGVTQDP